MTHGGAGDFDIPLTLSGDPGVEGRRGEGNFTIVFTFDMPVTSGTATTSAGSVGNVSYNGNNMIVSLTGVTDQQIITVTAQNVKNASSGTLASALVRVGILLGDVNGSGTVDSGDALLVRQQSGTAVTAGTFRTDVTIDGFHNVGDAIVVRNNSSHTINP